MKPPVKKVVVYVVDFARNAIKMGRGAALGQILWYHPPIRAGSTVTFYSRGTSNPRWMARTDLTGSATPSATGS